jgi:hypothetical protein
MSLNDQIGNQLGNLYSQLNVLSSDVQGMRSNLKYVTSGYEAAKAAYKLLVSEGTIYDLDALPRLVRELIATANERLEAADALRKELDQLQSSPACPPATEAARPRWLRYYSAS